MLENPISLTWLISLIRVSERVSLTLIIVLLSITVLVGFWKKVQDVDFKSSEKVGIAVSGTFAVPVLVLFSLMLYASIAINSQVSVSSTQVMEEVDGPPLPVEPSIPGAGEPLNEKKSIDSFVGVSPLGSNRIVGLATAINTVADVNLKIQQAGIPDNLRDEIRRLNRAVVEFNRHLNNLMVHGLGQETVSKCTENRNQPGCEVFIRVMEENFE